jgi:glycosyltransferase involved in cell wall biosynthesis
MRSSPQAAKPKVYVASSVGVDYFFFLANTIRHAGYEVKELFLITEDDYRRQARSSGLMKIWLRIRMYLLYPVYLLVQGLRCERLSIFVVSSNTFYAPWMVRALLGFRRIKVIHMLYDLFPDALEIAGKLDRRSLVSRAIGVVARHNQSSCDGTVYLGRFLRQHAETRWGHASHSDVIDISTDLSLYDPSLPELPEEGTLIVHYGGQLGHLHDARSIIAAVQAVCGSELADRVRFNFYVSGAQAELLKVSLVGYPVEIISTTPSSQWRKDIRNFHLGLVSLSPGGASVCLPSKTYAMMAGGLAILAIAPEWSDLSQLVSGLDAGWVINNSKHASQPDSADPNYLDAICEERPTAEIVADFQQTLAAMLADRGELSRKRRNAFEGVREHFGIDRLSERWLRLITAVQEA